MRNRKIGDTPYALLDIEVTRPLPAMSLKGEKGIAVVVRRNGKPVHFWMSTISKDGFFTERDLARMICRWSGTSLFRASVRENLRPPAKVTPFPSVTVAVCTRDRPQLLHRCLNSLGSLAAEVSGRPVSLEILVVDNAPSSEDTKRVVSAWPRVRYIREPRPGLDVARNRALKEARGELIAYVDDDTVVDSGWLAGLMEAWTAHPDAACFTGQVLPLELRTKAQVIFEQRGGFRRGFDPIRYGPTLPDHPVYPCSAGVFGTGANMAFQRQILDDMGGFDEALDTGPPLPAGGDHDIFYRIIRAGHPIVYDPNFLVFHEHRRKMASLLRQYWGWGLGVMTFMDKLRRTAPPQRRKRRYLIHLWFGEHIIELIKSLLGQAPVPCYMVLAEMAGGLMGLCGGYARSVRRTEGIRRQFPCRMGTSRATLMATHPLPSLPAIPPPDAPSAIFRPWAIFHLDLSQGVSPLSLDEGKGGGFLVFWWGNIPLGQCWVEAGRFPMRAAEVGECAINAIIPALKSYQLDIPCESPSPGYRPGFSLLGPTSLPALDSPLERLQERFLSASHAVSCLAVTVVVCTRDRPTHLKRCLASLQKLTQRPGEIIVVDNAPRSGATRQVVLGFPGIRYFKEPKAGLDAARNRGITNASGDIIAFTDDDAVAHPDWIVRMCQGFHHPRIMAVTGLVLPAELETEAQFLFERHWGFGRGYSPKLFGRRFFAVTRGWGVPVWEIGAGVNMAFRKEVFDHVGLFDERLDVGAAGCSGDSEMWYRILAGGWACRYEPSAVVYHYHRKGILTFHRQIFHYMRGHVTALLIQFERHRHWGNLRRLAFGLPWYYGGLLRKKRLKGFKDRTSTIRAEISGALSGITYYFRNR